MLETELFGSVQDSIFYSKCMSVYTLQFSFVKEKAWGGKKQQFLMIHKKREK